MKTWQQWQRSPFVRVRSRSEARPGIPAYMWFQRTRPNRRERFGHLPCRRSRVRVPSSALKRSPAPWLFVAQVGVADARRFTTPEGSRAPSALCHIGPQAERRLASTLEVGGHRHGRHPVLPGYPLAGEFAVGILVGRLQGAATGGRAVRGSRDTPTRAAPGVDPWPGSASSQGQSAWHFVWL